MVTPARAQAPRVRSTDQPPEDEGASEGGDGECRPLDGAEDRDLEVEWTGGDPGWPVDAGLIDLVIALSVVFVARAGRLEKFKLFGGAVLVS